MPYWFSEVLWFPVAVFCLRLVYASIVYYPFLLSKSKEYKSTYTGGVSVIVCVHNQLENTKKLLQSLLAQKFADFEIILVDDRSDEEAYLYMYELAQKEPKIKFSRIESTPPHISSKKFALTMGIKHAKNEVVLLTDADCLPASDEWIMEMTAPFAEGKDVVLGYSGYAKLPTLLNSFIRYETLLTALNYFSFAYCKMPYMGVGRNLAYRKQLFLSNKGFHPYEWLIGGDDDLLIQKIARSSSTALVYHPYAHTVSIPKTAATDYIQQKKRHLSVGGYYKFKFKVLLNLPLLLNFIFITGCIAVLAQLPGKETALFIAGLYIISLFLFTALPLYFSNKIKEGISISLLPLFEIYHTIHYFVVGMWVTVSKNKRW